MSGDRSAQRVRALRAHARASRVAVDAQPPSSTETTTDSMKRFVRDRSRRFKARVTRVKKRKRERDRSPHSFRLVIKHDRSTGSCHVCACGDVEDQDCCDMACLPKPRTLGVPVEEKDEERVCVVGCVLRTSHTFVFGNYKSLLSLYHHHHHFTCVASSSSISFATHTRNTRPSSSSVKKSSKLSSHNKKKQWRAATSPRPSCSSPPPVRNCELCSHPPSVGIICTKDRRG